MTSSDELDPPRVLVVQPERVAPLDRMEAPLAKAGLDVHVVRPYAGEPLPRGHWDGLIVLGGPMSSGDDDEHPWLLDVRATLAEAVAASVPTLGICLGAQLLAHACGGRVERSAVNTEIGVVQIGLRPDAADDPLLGGLSASFPAAELHLDAVVDLPPNATWLGQSDVCPHQAFRVGAAAWGVQFHPEVSLAGYESWMPGFSGRGEVTERVHAGSAQLRENETALANLADALSAAFADVVHSARRA